jgi:hypothetical protein
LRGKILAFEIGIAIEIEKNYRTDMFDPEPDSDFDFDMEKAFKKYHQVRR